MQPRLHPEGDGDVAEVEVHVQRMKKAPCGALSTGLAKRIAALVQTRLRYSPVRVSISTVSPWATKMGTPISKPVAILAGLSTLPEVSPLTAGSVKVTSRSTLVGS